MRGEFRLIYELLSHEELSGCLSLVVGLCYRGIHGAWLQGPFSTIPLSQGMYCRGELDSGNCFFGLVGFIAGVNELLHPCGSGVVTKPGMQTALLHWGVPSCLSLSTCLKRLEQWCWREWNEISCLLATNAKPLLIYPEPVLMNKTLMLIVIRVTRAGGSRTLMCWFSRALSNEEMPDPSVLDISASN